MLINLQKKKLDIIKLINLFIYINWYIKLYI